MTAVQGFTARDLESLPDIPGIRYEIIDGELLVSRAPRWRHDFAIMHLGAALVEWDPRSERGFALPGVGLVLSEDNDVIPDLVWISRARLAEVEDEKGHLSAAPEVIIEVLSPGRVNEVRDRELKLSLYARQGVQEYWIVDWQLQRVDVFRRRGSELELVATLSAADVLSSPLLPGFVCPVSDLWQPPL